MAIRFVHKRFSKREALPYVPTPVQPKAEEKPIEEKKQPAKNKKVKKIDDMNTNEQVSAAEAAMEEIAPVVKHVKKDRSLIERTESSKIILAEDNRQVLND